MMEATKKFSLRNLFYNNKFLLIFSFVVAFFIWAGISMQLSPEKTDTISDVKISIGENAANLKNAGLQVFGSTDLTVDITVQGKQYLVQNLTADDIIVTAQVENVNNAGRHTLKLKAEFKKSKADLKIVGLSKESIDVFFDVYKEQEFQLVPSIIAANGIVPDGFIYDDPVFSVPTVVLGGPQTEISRVSKVVGSVTLDAPITASLTQSITIEPQSQSGETLSNVTVKDSNVTMTIQVLKVKMVPVTVNFLNAPGAYAETPLRFTCSPHTVTVAGPAEVIDGLTALPVGTINFNEIGETSRTFIFLASDLTSFRIMDEGVTRFQVSIPGEDRVSSSFSIPYANIMSPTNVPAGFTARITEDSSLKVTVVGPRKDVNALTAGMIFADVDLSKISATPGAASTVEVPVNIRINGNNTCWAHGTYSVMVALTPNP